MALSQKDRTTIYTGLHPILGEEATEALLSHFPARDLDEPVTKEFVRAEIAGFRAEMHAEIAGLRGEMTGLRGEMYAEIAALELRMKEYVGRRIAASTAFLAVLVTVFGFLN